MSFIPGHIEIKSVRVTFYAEKELLWQTFSLSCTKNTYYAKVHFMYFFRFDNNSVF